MAQEEIEIEIGPDGRVTVTTHGIKGEVCRDYAAAVARIIGRIEESTPTSELYETPDQVRRTIELRERR
jgi:hypothetical protein